MNEEQFPPNILFAMFEQLTLLVDILRADTRPTLEYFERFVRELRHTTNKMNPEQLPKVENA